MALTVWRRLRFARQICPVCSLRSNSTHNKILTTFVFFSSRHTVGPVGEHPDLLQSCYRSTLDLCVKHHIRTVSLCCVSTGIFGYPLENATHVALRTVREWLQTGKHRNEVIIRYIDVILLTPTRLQIDRIVFCLFLPKEVAM